MEIENEVTVSTHNGSQVARQHSLRNPKVIAKENRIYPNYKMKNLVYQHLFAETKLPRDFSELLPVKWTVK